jgi:hypothetical protein
MQTLRFLLILMADIMIPRGEYGSAILACEVTYGERSTEHREKTILER